MKYSVEYWTDKEQQGKNRKLDVLKYRLVTEGCIFMPQKPEELRLDVGFTNEALIKVQEAFQTLVTREFSHAIAEKGFKGKLEITIEK